MVPALHGLPAAAPHHIYTADQHSGYLPPHAGCDFSTLFARKSGCKDFKGTTATVSASREYGDVVHVEKCREKCKNINGCGEFFTFTASWKCALSFKGIGYCRMSPSPAFNWYQCAGKIDCTTYVYPYQCVCVRACHGVIGMCTCVSPLP